jgi:uncharacterized repeat protein (TIGR03803 family)
MKRTRFSPRCVQASAAMFALLLATSFAAAQTEQILHRFGSPTDGSQPESGLIADDAGNLYGTTYRGGTFNWGTVYELTPPAIAGGAWTETILHEFSNRPDGAYPEGPLTFDSAGNLFGTTSDGGAGSGGYLVGTVFELSPPATTGGTWGYATIASFTSSTIALGPGGKLIFDQAGNLYGTSGGGIKNDSVCGPLSCGNVFELQRPSVPGSAWTETSIYDFLSSGTTDGISPHGLILGGGGVLYGTTSGGGTRRSGTFYKLTPPATVGGSWTEKVLYNFSKAAGEPFGPNALELHSGSFFGTSQGGGTLEVNFGTVFQLIQTSPEDWTVSVLYSFGGAPEGAVPTIAGVISDAAGNLYGLTNTGGITNLTCFSAGCGIVFELSPPAVPGGAWTETTLHEFAGDLDGWGPLGGLTLVNGSLFGTTTFGGTTKYNGGTVFQINP